MKIFKTLKVVNLRPGEIQLDDEQARRRKAQVRETSTKGVYEPTAMLTFKAGEKIGVPDGFLTKRELEQFVSMDEAKAKEEPVPAPVKKTIKRTKK